MAEGLVSVSLSILTVHTLNCVSSPVESVSPLWLSDSKAHHPTHTETRGNLRLLRWKPNTTRESEA